MVVIFFSFTQVAQAKIKTLTSEIIDLEFTSASYLKDPTLITANGQHITIRRITNSKKPTQKILIQSGLHGNEKGAIAFNQWLLPHFKNLMISSSEWKNTQIDFILVANPDGYLTNNRYNSNAVNLNRNFSVLFGQTREYPGKMSFSETETKAVRALALKEKYNVAIDVHGYINWVVLPTSPSIIAQKRKISKPEIAKYKKLYKTIAKNIPQLKNYKQLTAGFLQDGGSFEDWMFWEGGAQSFCLEIKKNHMKEDEKTRLKSYQAYANFLESTIKDLLNKSSHSLTAH